MTFPWGLDIRCPRRAAGDACRHEADTAPALPSLGLFPPIPATGGIAELSTEMGGTRKRQGQVKKLGRWEPNGLC